MNKLPQQLHTAVVEGAAEGRENVYTFALFALEEIPSGLKEVCDGQTVYPFYGTTENIRAIHADVRRVGTSLKLDLSHSPERRLFFTEKEEIKEVRSPSFFPRAVILSTGLFNHEIFISEEVLGIADAPEERRRSLEDKNDWRLAYLQAFPEVLVAIPHHAYITPAFVRQYAQRDSIQKH